MWAPPPPPGYRQPARQEAPASEGPGLGFYVKAGLAVAAIFGVAAVLSNTAQTTREVRYLVRPPRNETSGG